MEQLRTLALNAILKRLLILARSEDDITCDRVPLPPPLLRMIRRKLESVEEWLKNHQSLIRDPERFIGELAWHGGFSEACTKIDRLNTILNILSRRRSDLNACERFELAAIYCLHEQTLQIWPELSQEQQQKYLAERMHQHDPIVIFWTGVCARQPWLSDSYLVRAFYWAAEHDRLEALEHFWDHIIQERTDAVTFRAVRAFQLAACRGHLASLLFLWKVTDDEQHRAMIQGTLTYTQGALYAFESACKDGQYDLVEFIFQEADYQQRVIILGAEECRAFRLASEGGHLEVLRLFLEKSTRMNLKRHLLEAENCYAFRRALVNGHEAVVDLIWTSADSDTDRQVLLNAALYSSDMKEIASNNPTAIRIMNYLWKNSPVELRSLLFSQYVTPKMAKKFYAPHKTNENGSVVSPSSVSSDSSMARFVVPLSELSATIESAFFDICAMDDLSEVRRFVENKLFFEYGKRCDGNSELEFDV